MVVMSKKLKFGSALFLTAAFIALVTVASLDGTDAIRITPTSITVTSDSGLPAEVKAQEAASVKNLFDRDTTTDFTAFAANSVHIQLDGSQTIDNLKVFGSSSYKISVRSYSQNTWNNVTEWTNVDLSKLNDGWQSLTTKTPFTAEALELNIVPNVAKGKGKAKVTVAAAIKEIEFWSKGNRTLITDANVLDYSLKLSSAEISSYAKSYTATPAEAIVNQQATSFTLQLPYQANQIEKVWLSYDTHGISNWVSAKRSINGHTAVGGDYQFTQDQWKTLYEPIHPQWLTQGSNNIEFSLPTDVSGSYRIRNLRLLVLLDDGAHFAQSITASPQSSLNDAALSHDGDTDTGWQPFLSATDKNAKPTLQIDFEKNNAT